MTANAVTQTAVQTAVAAAAAGPIQANALEERWERETYRHAVRQGYARPLPIPDRCEIAAGPAGR